MLALLLVGGIAVLNAYLMAEKAPNPLALVYNGEMVATPSPNAPDAAQPAAFQQPLASSPQIPLNQVETEHLLFMREEEKMARDVYQRLFQRWGVSVFASITRSEQRHVDAVGRQIQRYGVPDPMNPDIPGQFKDPRLADLYKKLIARGDRSIESALRVGGVIEETDIRDLDNAIAQTRQPEIVRVYTLIQRGSFNHLRAFVHGLELRGVAYAPSILDSQRVKQILQQPMDTGFFGRNSAAPTAP
ncbi:DUF2202 domain-containing protein [Magnetofaba australis]|uniref:DUF2202 domain-containing protein n=1 Tax=Magnetofaba australis TaxID=1472297 RepID=UPI001301FA63|nr:DUF2202 domain-containing protein [Magnetofaba australis]